MEYLLDFVRQSYALSHQVVDRCSHKFSKQTFIQPQLIVLNLIRIKCDWTYRETKEALILMPGVQETLDLDIIPHHTTIHKAFDRLESRLGRLLLTKRFGALTAVDMPASMPPDSNDPWLPGTIYNERR